MDFELEEVTAHEDWIFRVAKTYGWEIEQLTYVFCSDAYLYEMNVTHLQHDTLTDIITFPYAPPPLIYGDLFISVERVRDNAQKLNTTFAEELRRVMIHGVLHLGGFSDKIPKEKAIMRGEEDRALEIWQNEG